MMQFAGGELLSPEYLTRDASIAFLFGLRNAMRTVGHLMVQRMGPPPTDDEFMGMADYIVESFHDLLAGDSESIFGSNSSRGSHYPSREYFMAGTPEGRVKSVHEGGATPTNDFNDEVKEDAGAFPRMQVEQLRAWHQELKDARL